RARESRPVDAMLDPPTSRDYGASREAAAGDTHREERAYARAESDGSIRRITFLVQSQIPPSGEPPRPQVVTVRIAVTGSRREEPVTRLRKQVEQAVARHLVPQTGSGIPGGALP